MGLAGTTGAATTGAAGAAAVGTAVGDAAVVAAGLDIVHAAWLQDLSLADWQPTSNKAIATEMNGTHDHCTKRFTFCIYFSFYLGGLQPSI
jgi:hypothetical protein